MKKTPKSKFRLVKKKFQEKIEENSDNSDISMFIPHISPRESEKVLRCATLTPSTGNLRRKTAANRELGQFLVLTDPDNNKPKNMSEHIGKMGRIHLKRKLNQNIKESNFEDHFSPKNTKIGRKC